MMARRLTLCAAALLAAGCTHIVDGTAVPGYGAAPNLSGVDVNRVLLEQSRMQAITGGGEHLTIIPSMDGDSPVDIDALAPSAPPECRFVYADSATFGPRSVANEKPGARMPFCTFADASDGSSSSASATRAITCSAPLRSSP